MTDIYCIALFGMREGRADAADGCILKGQGA